MRLIFQQQIEDFITAQYPDQTDYWLNGGREKHGQVVVAARCANCGHEASFTVKSRAELKRLLNVDCPECAAHEAEKKLPFGKFRGMTINEVMDVEPSYLAWFVDQIKGQDALIEQIKNHPLFPQAWAEYVEEKGAKEPPPPIIPFASIATLYPGFPRNPRLGDPDWRGIDLLKR